jgi:hypothetical protein
VGVNDVKMIGDSQNKIGVNEARNGVKSFFPRNNFLQFMTKTGNRCRTHMMWSLIVCIFEGNCYREFGS